MNKVGRYDILEELGRGATGVVYRASDPTIGRVVALKVLSLVAAGGDGGPGAREIFMREARAAGRLSHPGIVTIHDALEDPETQSSCIVMEFVPGRTLEKILALEPRFETSRALEIACEVAEALDYAHRHNVIHRDLKPANVILTDDGHAKLTDFGIAKIMARERAHRSGSIMGTPSYMSPEQVAGGEVDACSDLFSLGIMLYVMLTGERPFKGDTAAVMFKIAYEDPVLPSRLNPELSQAHDYIVLRCLAKSRGKRYSSAREFLEDLEDARQGRAPGSEAKVPFSELRAGEPTIIPELTPASLRPSATRRAAWIGAGFGTGLVLLASLVGLWIFHRRHISGAPPASASVTAARAPRPTAQMSPTSAGKKVSALRNAGPALPGKAAKPPHRTLVPTASRSARPSHSATASEAASAAGRVAQIVCRHDLVSATLTVSSSNQVVSRWSLKGKKKGGFLGIKASHRGTFSSSLTIPGSAHELSVRVVSSDGSFDLSSRVSATPPAGSPAILQVEVSGDHLTVNWQSAPHPKR